MLNMMKIRIRIVYLKKWTHTHLRHWIYVAINNGTKQNCHCNSSPIHLDDDGTTFCNSWHCNYPPTIQLSSSRTTKDDIHCYFDVRDEL